MKRIESRIDTSSPAYRGNYKAMTAIVAKYRERMQITRHQRPAHVPRWRHVVRREDHKGLFAIGPHHPLGFVGERLTVVKPDALRVMRQQHAVTNLQTGIPERGQVGHQPVCGRAQWASATLHQRATEQKQIGGGGMQPTCWSKDACIPRV